MATDSSYLTTFSPHDMQNTWNFEGDEDDIAATVARVMDGKTLIPTAPGRPGDLVRLMNWTIAHLPGNSAETSVCTAQKIS